MAVLEDKFRKRITMIRIPERYSDLSPAVDEADLSVLLHGSQTFREDPCPSVLRRNDNLASIRVIVPPLAVRAEDSERVIRRCGGPVELYLLSRDLPGFGILDGDVAVILLDGDEIVIE